MDYQASVQSDVPVRRYRTESGARIVADLGPGVDGASVDVLEDVAIVVLGNDPNAPQFELELPEAAVSDTFITNGVLTIEVIEE